MPSFEHQGATIRYETHGEGFPILTFAPAGLVSVMDVWRQAMAPIDPTVEFADGYRVIAMDQRNAGGGSHGPITAQDGWDTYTADHVALLDHLGVARCHLYGQCIGGSFILNMLKRHPERVAAAVLAQPIGRIDPALPPRPARFDAWAAALQNHPEATPDVLAAFYRNLYEAGFVYCADRAFVATIAAPCLVLSGMDDIHPRAISEELARLIPGCELIDEWKSGPALDAARLRVRAFLDRHTPA
ncbi:pimeloyl-ACP methyl ester carboxylesterase [Stella humosa]|uniref:Pimeloyl-ACP methyl ester carboxylesterase n=1 Tax=Stella humosa TaxID=94 RepID=A0A3N1M7N5_9PROT|nr:alpha/beta hydrolase [Stella humosa]ROP99732.1 pimeloyl-ACP methyl ester carboxylesterase [Stella humosa]